MAEPTKRGRYRILVYVEDQKAMEVYSDFAEFDERPDASVPDLVREHMRMLTVSVAENAKVHGLGRRR